MTKTVVCYSFFEKPQSLFNLDFFLKNGVFVNHPEVDYIFCINGMRTSVKFPKAENIFLLERENKGLDFGAHFDALTYLLQKNNTQKIIDLQNNTQKIIDLPYNYFIFLNDGVIGPFIPAYVSEKNWTKLFTQKINDSVKLVGTSIVALPPTDLGKYGPRVEGFFFCTDRVGLQILWDRRTIFCIHPTKEHAIVDGEYGISRAILEAGYSMDCMLYKYRNVDWRDEKNWTQNHNKHPSRQGSYDGISIHPFEVIFHKWFWSYDPYHPVRFDEIQKYVTW